MKILVTGGAGFIGSAVVRYIINNTNDYVVNVDKLTYAGNLESLVDIASDPRYAFERADICDRNAMARIFAVHQPDAVMHLAAESHVDRSITGPAAFIETNIIGTYVLLESARQYWSELDDSRKTAFRFHHISTDEVYGDLPHPEEVASGSDLPLFTEKTPYSPSSPYSSSNALAGKSLPVYGNGEQIRDWLFVEDHARALYKVVSEGKVGETYNIGGHNERKNIDVVKTICSILDEIITDKPAGINHYADLITYVTDRPGHDLRYAIDASKIQNDLGWIPQETFESGIRKTVHWYLNNRDWWQRIMDGSYTGERLGSVE